MSKQQLDIEQLDKIHSDLFDMANSYAGDATGGLAVQIHHAANQVLKIKNNLQLNNTNPPMDASMIADRINNYQ